MKSKCPSWAREGDCPPALSRAPGSGVHRSVAKTLAQEKRADQAQGLARKGSFCKSFKNN